MKKQLTKKDLEEIVGGELPKLGAGEYFHAFISAYFFVGSIKIGDYKHAKSIYTKVEACGGRLLDYFKEMVQRAGININDYVN